MSVSLLQSSIYYTFSIIKQAVLLTLIHQNHDNGNAEEDEFAEEDILVDDDDPDDDTAGLYHDEMRKLNEDTEKRLAGSPLYDTGKSGVTINGNG